MSRPSKAAPSRPSSRSRAGALPADTDTGEEADTRGGHSVALGVALTAALLALAVSIYLAVEHYTSGTSFACPESATVNCLKVTTSRWSSVAGIPVAVLGVAYFAVMSVLVLLPLHRRRLRIARVAAAAVGVVSALLLLYVELFDVDAICLWCTAVHALALVLFAATLWRDVLT